MHVLHMEPRDWTNSFVFVTMQILLYDHSPAMWSLWTHIECVVIKIILLRWFCWCLYCATSVYVPKGAKATMTCSDNMAFASVPVFQWTDAWQGTIGNRSQNRLSVDNTGKMVVSEGNPSDSGDYFCKGNINNVSYTNIVHYSGKNMN